jgi:hypothetical protein
MYSIYVLDYFPDILLIRSNTLCVGDDFVYRLTTLNSQSSPCILEYFPCNLRIRLSTFHVFSIALRYFPSILRIRRKNEKYTGIIFYFRQHLASLKEQSFEKFEYGVLYWHRKKKCKK